MAHGTSSLGFLPGETLGGGPHGLEGLPGVRPGWHQPLEGPLKKGLGRGLMPLKFSIFADVMW